MKYRLLSLLLMTGTLLLSVGCSTVTKPNNNVLAQSQPNISETVQQTDRVLKRKVAIARFTDETRHSNLFAINPNGDRIGKQATDILAARLNQTGKFILLERSDLDKINSEKSLNNLQSDTIGADYLIIGSISEFGRSAESEVGVFSRNKIQKAKAKVNVRLVEVATGRVVYSEEGSGESTAEANTVFGVGSRAAYDSSLDDKAISAAISQLINNLINNLLDTPWRAYLVGQQEGLYIMTGGKSQGIQEGDIFRVMKAGKKVKNPQTGLMIELPGKEVASIRVDLLVGEGDNEVALCSLAQGQIEGDLAQYYVDSADK